MERVEIICVGGIKEKYLRDMFNEYEKRLSRFCRLTVRELCEHRLPQTPSESEISRALDFEGTAILAAASGCHKIALCVEGDMPSSTEISKILEKSMSYGGKTAFIIGSSYGLADKVKSECDIRISLSRLTFPHQLARCILAEQLYRAYKIRHNETYHK